MNDADLEAEAWLSAHSSRNDPAYDADIARLTHHKRQLAKGVGAVRIVESHGRSTIEVVPADPRNRSQAMATASSIAEMGEVPVCRISADASGPSFSQPPRHTHYKDDRRR